MGHGSHKKGLWVRWAESRLSDEDLDRIRMLPTRQNEYGYDPFGFNRDELKIGVVIARFFYKHYFRCRVSGIENIPQGRAMLVSNHSGQLPFDALCISAAVLFEGSPPRATRTMIEQFVPRVPVISWFFARCGQVVGTPENCRRLLEDEELLLVFPEGVHGISKPFTRRYQLQPFGHGFMRLALDARCPIIPVAVVGAEESLPALSVPQLGKLFGLPGLPIMPPLPLPSRFHIYFGEPVRFDDARGRGQELEQLVKQVRLSIDSLIQVGLRERQGIFA